MAEPGIEPVTSASLVRRATDCAMRCGSVFVCVCVCVRERESGRERGYLYSHVSGGKFYFEKIIAIFSVGKYYYMYGEKLPYLSSD